MTSTNATRKRRIRPTPLGELPESKLDEQSSHGKRIHAPGEGDSSEWQNRYTQNNIPFTLEVADLSELIIPANPLRVYVLVQNKDAAADIFINFGNDATDYNGIIIIPRGNYELIGGAIGGAYCPSNSIYLMCETANVSGVVTEGILPPLEPED